MSTGAVVGLRSSRTAGSGKYTVASLMVSRTGPRKPLGITVGGQNLRRGPSGEAGRGRLTFK